MQVYPPSRLLNRLGAAALLVCLTLSLQLRLSAEKVGRLHRAGHHSETKHYTSLDLVDLKVRVRPGTAVAISQTHLIGSIDGHAVDGLFRNTRVYGRSSNGQWRILNTEATRVSGSDKVQGEMEGGTPLPRPSSVIP